MVEIQTLITRIAGRAEATGPPGSPRQTRLEGVVLGQSGLAAPLSNSVTASLWESAMCQQP